MSHTDRFTGKEYDSISDRLPHYNGQKCDTCGGPAIDHCAMCGAPQCCPKCCAEARPSPKGETK